MTAAGAAALLAATAAALAMLVASAQPTYDGSMRRVPVAVEDRPETTPNYSEATPKYIVIEGALP